MITWLLYRWLVLLLPEMAHISIFFTTIKVVRLLWIGIWEFSLFLWYVSGRKGTFYNHSHNNNHGLYVFLRGLFDRLFFLYYSQSQIQSTSPQLFWSGFDLINKDKFINVNAMISMMIVTSMMSNILIVFMMIVYADWYDEYIDHYDDY